jgi:glycosyltransferase involved in cell wall biosynthesis
MGATRIANSSNGFVIDPFDEEGWINAMQTVARDRSLARSLGMQARQDAEKYTWRKVSHDRQRALINLARKYMLWSSPDSRNDCISHMCIEGA